MCRIIAVANQKGGVGKTTVSINLGVGLTKKGKRVLLVDADPQGHLTIGLGYAKNLNITLETMLKYVILGNKFNPKEAVLHSKEGVDIVPSNTLLAGMELSLITVTENREMILRNYLNLLKEEYDYIIIDGMPSLGMLTINALAAADSVLIPVQTEYYAVEGLQELLKAIKSIRQRVNPALQVEGIVFTIDSARYNNSKQIKKAVRGAYGNNFHIFNQAIPSLVEIAEAPQCGTSLFMYKREGAGAASFLNLTEEVLEYGKTSYANNCIL